jgi:hypothetical protein
MNSRKLALFCLSTCFMLAGCDTQSKGTVTGEEVNAPHEWFPETPERGIAPDLESEAGSETRQTRRITIDQLRRSIPDLFGGETWTVSRGRTESQAFDVLARTLGEADYNEVTESVTDPSPLFLKFMDDMAAQMCSKAIEHDLSEPDAIARWVVRNPNDLDETLRFLRLKFHGIYVAEDASTDSDGLEDLRQLFSDIESDTDVNDAWVGLCMAVVTAPEFLAY